MDTTEFNFVFATSASAIENSPMPNQTVMDIDQLLDRVKSYNADADLGIVRKAYDFSAKAASKASGGVRESPTCSIPSPWPVCSPL